MDVLVVQQRVEDFPFGECEVGGSWCGSMVETALMAPAQLFRTGIR
ncbi:hypothetical protein ACWC9U_32195 [Streptomyces sp. 900116325]